MTYDAILTGSYRSQGSRSQRLYFKSKSHPVKGNTLDTDNNQVWKFPHPETSRILKRLEKSRDIESFEVPKLSDKSFEREILRLKHTLILWENTPCKKVMSSHEILHNNLLYGWKFAEELDDLCKSSVRLSSLVFETFNIENIDESALEIEGIDSIFPACLLLPFDKGEDTNDYDWSDIPVQIDDDVREEFKLKVLDYIKPVNINPPRLDSVDLLSLMGSATNFDFESNTRLPKSVLKGKNPSLELEREEFKFSLTSVYKNPHEPRCIVVPTPETLNSLMLLEKQLAFVLDVPSDCFNCKDFYWLERWLTGNGHYRYLMSDQKKCGLTFPREILQDMFDVLEEAYPDWNFGLFRSGFTSPILVKGDKAFTPKRGVGLGMMNGAISAATSIIFEMFKENNSEYKLSGQFYNDDQVIRYKVINDGRELPISADQDIADGWADFMEQHGFIISKSKPFVCNSGLLLEIYGKDFPIDTMKRTQYIGQLYKSLTMKYIHERKEHVAAVYDCLPQEYLELANKVVEDIIINTGYEFSPDEVNVPFEVGGWVRFMEEGVNTLFTWMENAGYDYRPFANILLVEKPYVGIDKRMKKNLPTLKKLLKNLSDFADRDLAFDYYQIAKNSLALPSKSVRERSYAGEILRRRRLEMFNKELIPFEDDHISVIYWSVILSSKSVYAPPKTPPMMLIETSKGCDVEREFPFEYHDPTRLLCMIQEECGLSVFEDIYYPIDIPDKYMMGYLFIKKITCDLGYEVTLNDILVIHHLGLDRWNRLLDLSYEQHGKHQLPAVRMPSKEIESILGFNDRTEIVHVFDELRVAVPLSSVSNPNHYDNRLAHFIMDIHEERDRKGLPNEANLSCWEDVEELLFPDRLDHPLVVSMRNREILVDPELPNPQMPDELIRLFEQLAEEQNAPRRIDFTDYIIMWTVWLRQRFREFPFLW